MANQVFTDEQINEILSIFRQNLGHRQYIGARYVPIFGRKDEESIEWDDSAPYEPLTIVLHEGNSFTSRQYVPTGININNLDFWAETGNYNAQVEQYRQEVLNLAESVETLETAVFNPTMNIYTLNIVGACTIVECAGKYYVFDVGAEQDVNAIRAWLRNKNVSKVESILVSHFHWDHCGGLEASADYVDGNTALYMQMATPTTNSEYNAYATGLAALTEFANTHELASPVVPVNNSTQVFNDETELYFVNTDVAYTAYYEAAWANKGQAAWDERINGINNYSVVCRVTYKDNVFWYLGDIEGEAQRILTPYATKATVATTPHHLANLMGYCGFFDKLSPQIWLAQISSQNPSSQTINYSTIYASYMYKYVKLRNNATLLTNNGTEVNIAISYNNATVNTGNIVGVNGEGNYTAYMLLPPTYYNENPYILRTIELGNLADLSPKFPYNMLVSARADSTFLSGCKFFTDLVTLFAPAFGSNSTFRLVLGKNYIEAYVNSPNVPFNAADIYYNFDIVNKIGYRMRSTGSAVKKIIEFTDTPITTGGSIASVLTEAEIKQFFYAEKIGVRRADSNTWFTCSRMMDVGEIDTSFNTSNKWYQCIYSSVANPLNMTIISFAGTVLRQAVAFTLPAAEPANINIDAIAIYE